VPKNPAIGLCLAAATFIATPALSDSCLPQQHVHQYIRAHYAHNVMRTTTRIAYRRAHVRHYVMMEEPYYDTYDEYYDVSGPYWHARSGWWEWHPADDDYL
jgi:hypothetical protein